MENTNECKFLTENELIELTGAKYPKVQKRVLDNNRIPYFETKNNKLKVTWLSLNKNNAATNAAPRRTEESHPSFGHL